MKDNIDDDTAGEVASPTAAISAEINYDLIELLPSGSKKCMGIEEPDTIRLNAPKERAQMPDIDHLQDGTVKLADGSILPLFDVGDKIVVQRHSQILKSMPWIDTRTYTVRFIDDAQNLVHCIDDELIHCSTLNYANPQTRVKLSLGTTTRRVTKASKNDLAAKAAGVTGKWRKATQKGTEKAEERSTKRKRGAK
jgi:hypothetical protein